jgi:hypothetical protein
MMVRVVNRADQFGPHESTIMQSTRDILSSLANSIESKDLLVDLDIDPSAANRFCSSGVSRMVEQLIELAIARSPKHCDLGITILNTRRGLEIEISDCGSTSPDLADGLIAFRSQSIDRIPRATRWVDGGKISSEAHLFGARCPQGGMAWTLVIPDRKAMLKVA